MIFNLSVGSNRYVVGGDDETRPTCCRGRHARGLSNRPPDALNFAPQNRPFRVSSEIKISVHHRYTDIFGGDDETRTHYLYNANVALYQMSYAPKYGSVEVSG